MLSLVHPPLREQELLVLRSQSITSPHQLLPSGPSLSYIFKFNRKEARYTAATGPSAFYACVNAAICYCISAFPRADNQKTLESMISFISKLKIIYGRCRLHRSNPVGTLYVFYWVLKYYLFQYKRPTLIKRSEQIRASLYV